MTGQWGAPPTVIEDRPFGIWSTAWEDELFSMFDKTGGDPYNYAISQGWPSDSLNSSWTLGVGWSQGSDGSFMVYSLSENSTHRDRGDSRKQYYWVLVAKTWITDPKTLEDTQVEFFW